ncbi:hypothetical protein CXB51_013990 [Gossypium anomalum]|uniref:Large ribosomal subunit protein bL34c n=1 Tax=Gossypium anomalum TaxID=47600 RepID=A0A8J5Z3I3_9ROSI|nr:hypothetical protein CXB51_013990 [Gossypium anomalum]
MASMPVITSPQCLPTKSIRIHIPSASLPLLTGSRRRISVSSNAANKSSLLHCSFLLSSSSSLSFPSSFQNERRRCLVVRAGKAALCQTKRNRSRKSLARTHGFRRRMRTTSGRAVLKRRRAKGRKVLCTNSNPQSGKR